MKKKGGSKSPRKKFNWDFFLTHGSNDHVDDYDYTKKDDEHNQTVFQRIAYLSQHSEDAIMKVRHALDQWPDDKKLRVLDSQNTQNITPLGQALGRGNVSGANILLSLGGQIDIAMRDQSWLLTLLEKASDLDAMRKLLQQSNMQCSIDNALGKLQQSETTRSALHDVCIKLINNRQYTVVQQLVNQGARPENPVDLINLAIKMDANELAMDLIELFDMSSPEMIDKHGDTPLMIASVQGNCEVASKLLEKGADVTLVNHKNQNVMHRMACVAQNNWRDEHIKIAQRIIDINAQIINHSDEAGNNVAMLAAMHEHDALCANLLELVNIYATNASNQNILYLATSHFCQTTFRDIVEKCIKSRNQPYSLLDVPCDMEPELRKSLLKNANRLYGDLKDFDAQQLVSKVTPLSRIALSSSTFAQIMHPEKYPDDLETKERAVKQMSDILFTFINTESTSVDAIACGIASGNIQRAYKYLMGGLPITHNTKLLLKKIADECVNLGPIKDMMVIIQHDDILQEKGLIDALPLIRALPYHQFRISWAIEHWAELGSQYLLLSLEALKDSQHPAIPLIYKLLKTTGHCPYFLLDRYPLGSADNFPINILQRLCQQLSPPVAAIPVAAINDAIEYKQVSSSSKDEYIITTTPINGSVDITAKEPQGVAPAQKTKPQDTADHKDDLLLQTWLEKLNSIQSDFCEPGQQLPKTIEHAFLGALERCIMFEHNEKFNQHPAVIIQSLVMLHRCEQTDKRMLFFDNLKRAILNVYTKIQPSSVHHPMLRLERFCDSTSQRKLDQTEVLEIANIFIEVYHDQQNNEGAQDFFDEMVSVMLDKTAINFDDKSLAKWLAQHFSNYATHGGMIRLLNYVIDKVKQERIEIHSITHSIVVNLTTDFLDRWSHFPKFMMFLADPSKIAILDRKSDCYRLLQSYLEYGSYIKQSNRSGSDLWQKSKPSENPLPADGYVQERHALIESNQRLRQENAQLQSDLSGHQQAIQSLEQALTQVKNSKDVDNGSKKEVLKEESSADFWAKKTNQSALVEQLKEKLNNSDQQLKELKRILAQRDTQQDALQQQLHKAQMELEDQHSKNNTTIASQDEALQSLRIELEQSKEALLKAEQMAHSLREDQQSHQVKGHEAKKRHDKLIGDIKAAIHQYENHAADSACANNQLKGTLPCNQQPKQPQMHSQEKDDCHEKVAKNSLFSEIGTNQLADAKNADKDGNKKDKS